VLSRARALAALSFVYEGVTIVVGHTVAVNSVRTLDVIMGDKCVGKLFTIATRFGH